MTRSFWSTPGLLSALQPGDLYSVMTISQIVWRWMMEGRTKWMLIMTAQKSKQWWCSSQHCFNSWWKKSASYAPTDTVGCRTVNYSISWTRVDSVQARPRPSPSEHRHTRQEGSFPTFEYIYVTYNTNTSAITVPNPNTSVPSFFSVSAITTMGSIQSDTAVSPLTTSSHRIQQSFRSARTKHPNASAFPNNPQCSLCWFYGLHETTGWIPRQSNAIEQHASSTNAANFHGSANELILCTTSIWREPIGVDTAVPNREWSTCKCGFSFSPSRTTFIIPSDMRTFHQPPIPTAGNVTITNSFRDVQRQRKSYFWID